MSLAMPCCPPDSRRNQEGMFENEASFPPILVVDSLSEDLVTSMKNLGECTPAVNL